MNDLELIEEARRVNHDLARNALGERVPVIDVLADRLQDLLAEVRAAALAEQGTEEREWEYRVVNKGYASESHETVELARREAGCEAGDAIERRRKAGPWMPVEGEAG